MCIRDRGRLSKEMLDRSGVDTSEDKWFVFKSNFFETVFGFITNLIKDNPTERKYFFIIDSMDSLIPSGDIDRSYAEATKVAGGAVLSSNFLKRMALPISTRGHICFMISQVRSTVSVNPYEKGDPKLTNATGGNALLHFSDWIFEFQKRRTFCLGQYNALHFVNLKMRFDVFVMDSMSQNFELGILKILTLNLNVKQFFFLEEVKVHLT